MWAHQCLLQEQTDDLVLSDLLDEAKHFLGFSDAQLFLGFSDALAL